MNARLDNQLVDEVEPIVSGMGFSLVELRLGRSHKQNHVTLVVYRPEGVGVDDLAAISKNLYPRLELIEELDNLRLQVSSPGLDRVLKSEREYSIFRGRDIRILFSGQSEWLRGRIEEAGVDEITLNIDGEMRKIKTADIRKAKLDS
jgi:ribosome maturation factor RimP